MSLPQAIDHHSGGDNILNPHRMKHGSRSTSSCDDNISNGEPSLTHVSNGLGGEGDKEVAQE